MSQCKAVKSIGTIFRSNKTIRTFNELKYFSNVTSLENYAFDHCTSLSFINLENITSLPSPYTFSDGAFLKRFLPSIISVGQYSLGNAGQHHTALQDLGASISSLTNPFRYVSTTLVVRAATPPTWTNGVSVNGNGKVYVPADALNTYKGATGWSGLASVMYAIGGPEWQSEFASATNPSSEYADVEVNAPDYYAEIVAAYEASKSAANS
jgi:hypothetical protein